MSSVDQQSSDGESGLSAQSKHHCDAEDALVPMPNSSRTPSDPILPPLVVPLWARSLSPGAWSDHLVTGNDPFLFDTLLGSNATGGEKRRGFTATRDSVGSGGEDLLTAMLQFTTDVVDTDSMLLKMFAKPDNRLDEMLSSHNTVFRMDGL